MNTGLKVWAKHKQRISQYYSRKTKIFCWKHSKVSLTCCCNQKKTLKKKTLRQLALLL